MAVFVLAAAVLGAPVSADSADHALILPGSQRMPTRTRSDRGGAAAEAQATYRGLLGNGRIHWLTIDDPYDLRLADGGPNLLPRQVVADALIREAGDEHDFLITFTSFSYPTGNALAFAFVLRNDVLGIGMPLFDATASFGSAGQLESYIDMGPLSAWTLDPLDADFENTLSVVAHEILHRWAAHPRFLASPQGAPSSALLGRDRSHWAAGLDSQASVLYGCDWEEVAAASDSYRCARALSFFSQLDLYLAGFLEANEVAPLTLLDSPQLPPDALPEPGRVVTATRQTVRIEDVIAAEGPRGPPPSSEPRRLHATLAVLTRPGETVSSDLAARLDTLASELERRFGILTGGRGLLTFWPALSPRGTPSSADPLSGGPPTGTADPASGIQWLLAQQAENGSWRDRPATRIRDTAEALLSLARLTTSDPRISAAVARGTDWLIREQPADGDAAARRARALAALAPASAVFDGLLAAQNPDGGWGLAQGLASTPLDTAIALDALRAAATLRPLPSIGAATARARTYLLASRSIDGGWPNATGGASRLLPTLLALGAIESPIDAPASAWLDARQRADGGFGEGGSRSHLTALALETLSALGRSDPTRDAAGRAFLAGRQDQDGSWDGSVFATALAVRVVAGAGLPNLTATTTIASDPPSPRAGEWVRIQAEVRNAGHSASAPTSARIQTNEPEPLANAAVPALQPVGAATVALDLRIAGDARGNLDLEFNVDPENLVAESDESDNRVVFRLPVREAPPGPDLVLRAHEMFVEPSAPSRFGELISVGVVLRNVGRAPALDATVAIIDLADPDGAPLAGGSFTVPPQSSAPVTLHFALPRVGEVRFAVVADPENDLAEDDEADNRIEGTVATQPAIDLAVNEAELEISGSSTLGSDVTFRFPVRNFGTEASPSASVRTLLRGDFGTLEIASLSVALAPGEARPITTVWRADRLGALTFEVAIDPEGRVPEADETNNRMVRAIEISEAAVANLAVSHRDLIIAPDPPREGQGLAVQVLVRNTSAAVSPGVTAQLFLGATRPERRVGPAVAVDPIAPHGSLAVHLAWPAVDAAGDLLLFVVVDPDGLVEEPDETDNVAFVAVHILGLPDLGIDPLTARLIPDPPIPGREIEVSVRVQNRGEQEVTSFAVELWLEGDRGDRLLARTRGLAIQALASIDASIRGVVPDDTTGGSFRLAVDPENHVVERREDDNDLRVPWTASPAPLVALDPVFSPNGDGVLDEARLLVRLDPGANGPRLEIHAPARPEPVRSIPLDLGATSHPQTIMWDGRDGEGRLVRDGDYSVLAVEASGRTVASAVLAVDTNRTSILSSLRRDRLLRANLTCALPDVAGVVPSPAEDRFFVSVPSSTALWPRGIYRVDPWGADLRTIAGVDIFAGAREPGTLAVASATARLAFEVRSSSPADPSQLWIVEADGSGLRLVFTAALEEEITIAGLSPDGTTLWALRRAPGASTSEFVRLDLAASNPVPSVVVPDVLGLPGNAPDGQWLIALAEAGGTNSTQLVLVGTSDGRRIQLDEAAHWAEVAWSPDSRRVVYRSRRGFTVFEPATGARVEIDGSTELVDPDSGVAIPLAASQLSWGRTARMIAVKRAFEMEESCADPFDRAQLGLFAPQGGGIEPWGETKLHSDCQRTRGESDGADDPDPDTSLPFFGDLAWDPNDEAALYAMRWVRSVDDPRWTPYDLGFESIDAGEFTASGHFLLLTSPDEARDPTSPCHRQGNADRFALRSADNLTVALQTRRLADGATVALVGTVTDRHLARWRLEYQALDEATWHPIGRERVDTVVAAPLASWAPPDPGVYRLRVIAEDRAGNVAQRSTIVSFGHGSSIADVYAEPVVFSPNGDGILDSSHLRYTPLEAMHLEAVIRDPLSGRLVRGFERDHTVPGVPQSIAWDGREDDGDHAPDGAYQWQLGAHRFDLVVDRAPPDLGLSADLRCCASAGVVAEVVATNGNNGLQQVEIGVGPSPAFWETASLEVCPDELFGYLTPERFTGASLRLEATDAAGNHARQSLSAPPAVVIERLVRSDSSTEPVPRCDTGPLLLEGAEIRLRAVETLAGPLHRVLFEWALVPLGPFGVPDPSLLLASDWNREEGTIAWHESSRFEAHWFHDFPVAALHALRVVIVDPSGATIISPFRLVQRAGLNLRGLLTRAILDAQPEPTRAALRRLLDAAVLDIDRQRVVWGTESFDEPLLDRRLRVRSIRDPRFANEISLFPVAEGDGILLFTGDLLGCAVYEAILEATLAADPEIAAGGPRRFQALAELRPPCLDLEAALGPIPGGACGGGPGAATRQIRVLPQSLDGTPLHLLTIVARDARGHRQVLFSENGPASGREYAFIARLDRLPAGKHQLVFSLSNTKGEVIERTSSSLDPSPWVLVSDEHAPTAEILYPEEGQAVCGGTLPNGFRGVAVTAALADDWGLAFRAEARAGGIPLANSLSRAGAAERLDLGPDGFSTEPGCGWLGRSCDPFPALEHRGDVFWIENVEGPVTARLEVADNAGHLVCVERSFVVDSAVRPGLEAASRAFSPNRDERFEHLGLVLAAPEPTIADVRIRTATSTSDGCQPATSGSVRRLASAFPIDGTGILRWDGRDDDDGPLPDGPYLAEALVTDACGNRNASRSDCFWIDTQPPTLAIHHPNPTSALGTIVTLRGTAADASPFDYLIDYGLGASPDSWVPVVSQRGPPSGSHLGEWNTAGIWGPVTLRLSAVDAVGNASETRVHLELDRRTPLITAFEPTPALFSPNGDGRRDSAVIRFTLGQPAHVDLDILGANDGVLRSLLADRPASAGTTLATWDGRIAGSSPSIPDGAYTVRLRARPTANPDTREEEFTTVFVDATRPTVALASPSATSTVVGAAIDVVGSASDPRLRDYRVEWAIGKDGEWLPLASGDLSVDGIRFAALTDLPEGDLGFRLLAADEAENQAEWTWRGVVDATAPTVAWLAPVRAIVTGAARGLLPLRATLADPHFASWRLLDRPPGSSDWRTVLHGSEESTGDAPFASLALGAFEDGDHLLRLEGDDRAGNRAQADLPLTIDNTLPRAQILRPTAGALVTAATEIIGTADDEFFDAAALDSKPPGGGAPSSIVTIETPVIGSRLGHWISLPADGPTDVRLRVLDRAGNESVATVRVHVDTSPPAPPEDLSLEPLPPTGARLTWRAADPDDLSGFEIFRNGRVVASLATEPTSFEEHGLAEGLHRYQVAALDIAGLRSQPSHAVELTIDRSAPVASIALPRDGARVAGTLDVIGTAFADSFTGFRLSAAPAHGGVEAELATSTVPVISSRLGTWDTSPLEHGSLWTIGLEVEDAKGEVSRAHSRVAVDHRAPAIPNGLAATASGSTITVRWDANSEADLGGYLLARNGQLVNASGDVGDATAFLLRVTTYPDLDRPDGRFDYRVAAVDTAGNRSDFSAPVSLTLDRRTPRATIVQPTAGHRFDGSLRIRATGADEDVATVRFQHRRVGTTSWVDIATVAATGLSVWDAEWSADVATGSYDLRAQASDHGGRVDASPPTLRVVRADLTPPPAVTALDALARGGEVHLTWAPGAEPGLRYRVRREDRNGDTPSAWVTPSPIALTEFVDNGVQDGDYEYFVVAVDSTGNQSPESPRSVVPVWTLDFEQPFTPADLTAVHLAGRSRIPGVARLTWNPPSAAPGPGPADAGPDGAYAWSIDAIERGETRFVIDVESALGHRSRPTVGRVVSVATPSPPSDVTAGVDGDAIALDWTIDPSSAGAVLRRDGTLLLPDTIAAGLEARASSDEPWQAAAHAIDGNPSTAWGPSLDVPPQGQFLDLVLSSAGLVGAVTVQWAAQEAGGIPVAATASRFTLFGWDGEFWVPLDRRYDDEAALVILQPPHPYWTDRLRLVIQGARRPRLAEATVHLRQLAGAPPHRDTIPAGRHAYTVQSMHALGLLSNPTESNVVEYGDVTPPQPVHLAAQVNGSDVELRWTPSGASDLAGYELERSGSPLLPVPGGAEATTHVDRARPNGRYAYRIRAVDLVGNRSDFSNTVEVTVAIAPPLPPRSLTVEGDPAGRALLCRWQPPPAGPPAAYALRRSSLSGGPYHDIGTLVAEEYLDRGLANGTPYYYVVESLDAAGNRSEPSTEARGTPGNRRPPPVPTLQSPPRAEPSVGWRSESIVVAGFSEPGLTVEVRRDGRPASRVMAQLDLAIRTEWAFDDIAPDAVLSPDGRRVLQGPNWLFDLEARLGESIGDFQIAAWMPDSEGLLLVRDGTLGVLRTTDRSWTELGRAEAALGLAVSPVGRTALLAADHEGETGLWRIELETGSWHRLSFPEERALDPSTFVLSDDGRHLLVGQSSPVAVLLLVDTTSGSIIELPGEPLATASLAPGSRWVAAPVTLADGPRILLHEVASGLDEILLDADGTPVEAEAVVWLDEGDRLAVKNEGRLVFFDRRTRAPVDSGQLVPDGARLVATRTGRAAVLDWGAPIAWLEPPARFEARLDVRPGRQILDAIARDDSGNESPGSTPTAIEGHHRDLPDLVVEMIRVEPPLLTEGQPIRIGLLVRNLAPVESPSSQVSATLIDGVRAVTILDRHPIDPLGPWGSAAVEGRIENGLEPGAFSLSALADSGSEIAESDESNNERTFGFSVGASNVPHLLLAASSTLLARHQDVRLETRLRPQGAPVSSLALTLLDGDGNLVTEIHREAVPSGLGEIVRPIDWNAGDRLAGRYVMRLAALDPGGAEMARTDLTIEIAPYLDLAAELVADQATFVAPAKVGLRARVLYRQGNVILDGLDATLRVVDPDFGEIAHVTVPIGVLLPGDSLDTTIPLEFLLPSAAPFRAVFQVARLGSILTTSETMFQVGPAPPRFLAAIRMTPSRPAAGTFVEALIEVRNTGGLAATGVDFALRTANASTDETIATASFQADLGPGEILIRPWAIDLGSSGLIRALVTLSAQTAARRRPGETGPPSDLLAVARFETVDAAAPTLRIGEPTAGAIRGPNPILVASAEDDLSGLGNLSLAMDDEVWHEAVADPRGLPAATGRRGWISLADGVHRALARARDIQGNEAITSVTFEVDGTAPRIVVSGVEEGQRYTGPVTPTVEILDPHLDHAEVTLNGARFVSGSTIDRSGVWRLAIEALDSAGNRAALSVRFEIESDRIPIIEIPILGWWGISALTSVIAAAALRHLARSRGRAGRTLP